MMTKQHVKIIESQLDKGWAELKVVIKSVCSMKKLFQNSKEHSESQFTKMCENYVLRFIIWKIRQHMSVNFRKILSSPYPVMGQFCATMAHAVTWQQPDSVYIFS
jgi:hypothetical protein